MPDRVEEGPFLDFVRQMGIRGVQERYKVQGESPACICLLHGVSPARVVWAQQFYSGVVVVTVQVMCYPWCGYRLGWGRLTGGQPR